MKKVLVVLLIAVLAVSSVFATVSGSVEAGYTFDFEEKTAEYKLGGGYSKLSFTLVTDKGTSTGANKPYATATVDLAVFSAELNKANFNWAWTASKVSQTINLSQTQQAIFTLKEFKIVGENWNVDLLKAAMFGNYAKSAWEIDNTNDKNALSFNNVLNAEKGVTVTYDDYKVGIAAKANSSISEFKVSSETKKIEFEGGSAQAAIALGYGKLIGAQEGSFDFSGSVKADYKVSDVALAVAADARAKKDYFNADVSAKAAYKPVVFDFFYATEISTPAKAYTDTKNILSVRAQFDAAQIAEDVKVKVTAKAENLINDKKILSAEAEVKAIENLSLTVGFNDMLKKGTDSQKLFAKAEYTGIENITIKGGAYYQFGVKTFGADASVKYAAEKFDVTCAAVLKAADGAEAKVSGRVGISSDKLVENATLGADLVFDKNGLIENYADSNYLKAFVKVAF